VKGVKTVKVLLACLLRIYSDDEMCGFLKGNSPSSHAWVHKHIDFEVVLVHEGRKSSLRLS